MHVIHVSCRLQKHAAAILDVAIQSVALHILYVILHVADVSSQPVMASPVIERIDAQFQRLLDAVSKGEFPEKGQRLLSKLSSSLSSSFADSDVSTQGRDLNWDAPNISQNLLQVSNIRQLRI